MNPIIQTSQPAPKVFSLSSRIIAIASVAFLITLIAAVIIQSVLSWHLNFISDFIIIACALAHLCWVVSTVNMLRQDVSKWLVRMNQTALIAPNAVIVTFVVAVFLIDLICSDHRFMHIHKLRELLNILICIVAFVPPVIAWITNTITVISSMIKVHKYLKSSL